MTISVVFPSCDQIQPMDGLFYTKDEVAPYCSPEDRGCFLLKILFDLHGRTSSYFCCLFKLPSTGVLHTAKKFFFFVYLLTVEACTCCIQQFQHAEVWIYQLIEPKMALISMSFSGSLLALLNSETCIDCHQ